MLTVRHIEKLWEARKYPRLLGELIAMRVEAPVEADLSDKACACAAALALIRLDELQQAHVPFCSKLIRAIVAAQELDGGWGDAMVTALCLAALSLQNGGGEAIDRGMGYLAQLQQPAGAWPRVPMRRMPQDAVVSAFILLQLGDNPQFRDAVHFEAAVAWFECQNLEYEPVAEALWRQARVRSLTMESRYRGGQMLLVN